MKHIKNAKVTAKIQIREGGAQIRVLGGTGTLTERREGKEDDKIIILIQYYYTMVIRRREIK